MNPYAMFPLIATIAYIFLLLTVIYSRPLQKRHVLFIIFLVPAMSWSLIDYFARSGFFPQYELIFIKAVLIAFTVMVVQFHYFTSFFYPAGQGRWLPFVY